MSAATAAKTSQPHVLFFLVSSFGVVGAALLRPESVQRARHKRKRCCASCARPRKSHSHSSRRGARPRHFCSGSRMVGTDARITMPYPNFNALLPKPPSDANDPDPSMFRSTFPAVPARKLA